MSALLSLTDLNTTVNHEPRILDTRIAEALGYEQPLNIRQKISENAEELSLYGEVFTEAVKTGKRGGRPSNAYYLNEPQALLLCMFSRTEKAAAVRKAVIEVFMAHRRGNLPAVQVLQPADPALMVEAYPALCESLRSIVQRRGGDSRKAIAYYWSRFNRHFKLQHYWQLPSSRLQEALEYLEEMPAPGEKPALPAPSAGMEALFQPDAELDALIENVKAITAAIKAMDYIDLRTDMQGRVANLEGVRWIVAQVRKEAVHNAEALCQRIEAHMPPGIRLLSVMLENHTRQAQGAIA